MSFARRLAEVVANQANRGCVTCAWLDTLSDGDRRAWDEWIDDGKSLAQLHEIAACDPDNPLPVSLTAVRLHMKHHKPHGS